MADLFMTSDALALSGPSAGIGYFARFGVTEKMIQDALSAALSKGGEYADVFFQHRVTNSLALEDGADVGQFVEHEAKSHDLEGGSGEDQDGGHGAYAPESNRCRSSSSIDSRLATDGCRGRSPFTALTS